MTGCRYLCIQQRVSKELTCIISLNIAVNPHMSHIICHISVICFIIWCLLSGKGCVCVLCGWMWKLSCEKHCDLFTVQKEVIPAILESAQQGLLIGRGGYKPRDICVSAPTGSGKTLAFVIPVIQVSCPTIFFGQDMHTTCVGSTVCVYVKKEHVERLFR